jgi:hypothetical protein
MKKILLLSILLIAVIFVVGCSPELSEEDAEAQLSELSADELDAVLVDDTDALAGQAIKGKESARSISVKKKLGSFIKTKKEEYLCEDSDSGRDYYKKGSIFQPNIKAKIDDICQSATSLIERDCGYINGVPYQDNCGHIGPGGCAYKCPNGCSNGACVKLDDQVDSLGMEEQDTSMYCYYVDKETGEDFTPYDNARYNAVRWSTANSGGREVDYCKDGDLVKTRCGDPANRFAGGEKVRNAGPVTIQCEFGCSEGAMVCNTEPVVEEVVEEPIFFCDDDDGGRNVAIKGTLRTHEGDFTDFCRDVTVQGQTINKLHEYYCINEERSLAGINCALELGNDATCVDGACVLN